jgi:hypothetical protein
MITAHRIRDYQQLIEACQLTEHSLVAVLAEKQAIWKRKRSEEGSGSSRGKSGDKKGKQTATYSNRTD